MRYFFSLLFFLCSSFAYSQQHDFVVLNVSGDVKDGHGDVKVAARIGVWLDQGDYIVVPDKASITLVCKSEGYIMFNKAGVYKLADYMNRCQQAKTNVMKNYMKYAWDEFTHHEGSTGPDAQERMENVGAASRGMSKCYAITDASLAMVNYCTGDLQLSWKKNTPSPLNFRVFEFPDGGNAIIDIPVSTNKYSMTQLAGKLKKGTDYFWALIPPGKQDECQRNHLQIWEKEDYEMLLKSYKEEVATITTDKADVAYMLGYMLEGTHFYAEAMNYYNEAVKLSPSNTRYAKAAKTLKARYE